MNQELFKPAFALLLLKLLVLLRLVQVRIVAAKNKQLDPHYFKTFQGSDVPRIVQQTERNQINLFETPVLFYIGLVFVILFDLTDLIFIYLSWSYVLSRYFHTIVHITSNKLFFRLWSFVVSLIILTAIWARVLYLTW